MQPLQIRKTKMIKMPYYKRRTKQVAKAELGNYFSITVDSYIGANIYACGCQHNLVEEHFPELAPYLKWHLVSTKEPMHYLANGLYHLEQNKIDYFKSTVLWGTVDSDKEQKGLLKDIVDYIQIAHSLETESLKKWISERHASRIKLYLEKRLPELMAHFREDMKTLFNQDIYGLLE